MKIMSLLKVNTADSLVVMNDVLKKNVSHKYEH